MSAWHDLLEKAAKLFPPDEGERFFRGQGNSTWPLVPRLARCKITSATESRLYYGFKSLGAHLFPPTPGAFSWNCLALMQHHGVPTRLLDWTEVFSVALYFAVRDTKTDACVWVLDPYKLNQFTIGLDEVPDLDELDGDYCSYFITSGIKKKKKFKGQVIAVYANRYSTRMLSQRGVFTLHAKLTKPLDALYPTAVKKLVIPTRQLQAARRYLRLAGINEYSLFGDLDSVARYVCAEETIA